MRPTFHDIGPRRVNPNGEPPLSPWWILMVLLLALLVLGFALFGTR